MRREEQIKGGREKQRREREEWGGRATERAEATQNNDHAYVTTAHSEVFLLTFLLFFNPNGHFF